ncbi:hypothetical protein [Streptomyces sp. SID11385]|uniref:hypothetical protein n=1 Tax=Streptomyces sp. SID11385 TaxID=2706031 RepID=UPI0013CB9926|nr:hypothetical protein [Streptomyces sp. SID11385]NEA40371.1 hypothetical protein [Streptomyces sp. SID11385]
MPLHLPPAPAAGLRSVRTALASPTAVHEAPTPALRTARGPLIAEPGLPVHVLDPTAPRSAGRTRLNSWRFTVRNGDRPLAVGEARLTADGWTFSHFFEGPYVNAADRAMHEADALNTPYQARLLSVPALYMLMLWLHTDVADMSAESALGEQDLLVPLAPAPPGFTAYLPLRAAQFLPVLERRLAPPASPAGLLDSLA